MDAPTQLVLDEHDIWRVSLAPLASYTTWHSNSRFFELDPGKEHYKLLAAISDQLPDATTVADLGTYLGFSALALSRNPSIRVVTYDIKDWIPNDVPTAKRQPNIDFRLQDCVAGVDGVMSCPVMMLDVDPHDGVQERRFLEALMQRGYRGVVLMDDIHVNRAMRACWKWIPLTKIDATHIGHGSGTGIVVFDPTHLSVVVR